MGIITVLCKGFILLCSMHKDVLSLMISRAVIHLFLQGKLNNCSCSCWVCAPAVPRASPPKEITQRTGAFPPPAQLGAASALETGAGWGFALISTRVSPLGLHKKWQNVHLLLYTKSGRSPAPTPPFYLLVSGESHGFTGTISSLHMMLLSSRINEICIFFKGKNSPITRLIASKQSCQTSASCAARAAGSGRRQRGLKTELTLLLQTHRFFFCRITVNLEMRVNMTSEPHCTI